MTFNTYRLKEGGGKKKEERYILLRNPPAILLPSSHAKDQGKKGMQAFSSIPTAEKRGGMEEGVLPRKGSVILSRSRHRE